MKEISFVVNVFNNNEVRKPAPFFVGGQFGSNDFQIGTSDDRQHVVVMIEGKEFTKDNIMTVPNGGNIGDIIMKKATGPEWAPFSLPYSTVAPTTPNTDGGLKIIVLNAEPAQKFDGYLYFVTEA